MPTELPGNFGYNTNPTPKHTPSKNRLRTDRWQNVEVCVAFRDDDANYRNADTRMASLLIQPGPIFSPASTQPRIPIAFSHPRTTLPQKNTLTDSQRPGYSMMPICYL